MPLIIIFGIMYFLILRPQSKRLKTHQSFLEGLKRGDQVVTNGGILGTVDGLTDQFVTLEIDQGVKIRVVRKQIAASAASVIATGEDKKSK